MTETAEARVQILYAGRT